MSDSYFFITSVIVLLIVYLVAHAFSRKDATHTSAHFIIMCLYCAAMMICVMNAQLRHFHYLLVSMLIYCYIRLVWRIFNTVTKIKNELQMTEQQECITQRRKEEYEDHCKAQGKKCPRTLCHI